MPAAFVRSALPVLPAFTAVDRVAELGQLDAAFQFGAEFLETRYALLADRRPVDLLALSLLDVAFLLPVHLQGTGDVDPGRPARASGSGREPDADQVEHTALEDPRAGAETAEESAFDLADELIDKGVQPGERGIGLRRLTVRRFLDRLRLSAVGAFLQAAHATTLKREALEVK